MKNLKKLTSYLYQCSEKIRQYPHINLFILIVGFILATLILIFIPLIQVSHYGINNTTTEADLENQFRVTLAQILGGVAIGIGLYYTQKRVSAAEKSLSITQESQITERFTQAINQLGNEKMEIRLGGIYALERIANESEKDYWPIIETLTAYVRKNSSCEVVGNNTNIHLPIDIQAILTILGKWKPYRSEKFMCPNLEGANLIEANLEGANLEGANLKGANLENANLERANLKGANLKGANLRANLWGATLVDADLEGANLEEANLGWANLGWAYLERAHLRGSHLGKANLKKATFWGAHLRRAHLGNADLCEANLELANLTEAHLEGAFLKEATLIETNLEKANLMGVHLEGANLMGAHLEGADLRDAHLEGAKNLTLDQLSNVKTLYNAELDDTLKTQLKEKYPALFEEPK